MSRIVPRPRRVLLRVLDGPEEVGGVALPESVNLNPMLRGCEVVALGEGVRDVEVGDEVLIGRYAGVDLLDDSIEADLCVFDTDLVAVVQR